MTGYIFGLCKENMLNLAAAILVLVEKKSGMSLVSPDIQVMGMAAINLGLRYITNSAISFTAPKA